MRYRRFAVLVPCLSAVLVAGCATGSSGDQDRAAPAAQSASASAPGQSSDPATAMPSGSQPEASQPDDHLHTIGDGTSAKAGDLELTVLSVPDAQSEGDLVLQVASPSGPVTDFAIVHEKPMHLMLVPQDLSTILHVHPAPAADGTWRVPVAFPFGGTWRAVADVALATDAGDQHYALATPVQVKPDSSRSPVAFLEPSSSTTADGYDIALSGEVSADAHGMLMAMVTQDGKPVQLQDWLGSNGHLVAFRQSDMAYAHMHTGGHEHGSTTDDHGDDHADDHKAMPGMLHFETEFPGAGRYQMFLQFKADDKVHTASFALDVA